MTEDHQLFIRPIWEDEDFTSEFGDALQNAAHVYAWEFHSKEGKHRTLATRPLKTLFIFGA